MLNWHKKARLLYQRWQLKPRAIFYNAALVTLLIGLFISIAMGMYPFGDRSILTVDLYHQYTPFLMELRRKLISGENLFMSFSVGLGINFWTVMAYYGFSPFNLLLLLFPAKLIPLAIWLIILLKIALVAVTMTAFLDYYYGQRDFLAFGKLKVLSKSLESYAQALELSQNKQAARQRYKFTLLVVACFYSWSGYVLAYLWNVMWLDAIFALPLIALGISKLIRERKLLTYLLSLTYAISVNYYTAIFICLFTALYSIVLLLDEAQYRYSLRHKIKLLLDSDNVIRHDESSEIKQDENVEKLSALWQKAKFNNLSVALFDFTLLSLLAALLSAHVLYPVWANFKLSSAAHDLFPSSIKWSFSFNQILNRLLAFNTVKVRSGEPNIYIGCFALCLVAVLLYRLYKRPFALLPKLALLFFIGLSFSNNWLNFIWHGLHYPNQLPHRFAFVFCFLLLQVVFEIIWRFQWAWSKYLLVGSMWLTAICLANFSLLAHNTTQEKIFLWLNIVLALAYLLISTLFTYSNWCREKLQAQSRQWLVENMTVELSLKRRLNKQLNLSKRIACILLCIVVIAELGGNALVQLSNLNNSEYLPLFSNYVKGLPEKQQLAAAINKLEQPYLTRLESTNGKTIDDGALYSYNGISLFSSTSNEKTAKALRRLGLNGNNLNSYKVQKPLNFFSDLFALRYFLTEEKEYQDWQKLPFAQINGAENLANKDIKWQVWQNLHCGKQAYLWPRTISNYKLEARNPYLNYNELAAQLIGKTKLSADFYLPHTGELPSLFNPFVVLVEKSDLVNINLANNEYELRATQAKKTSKNNVTNKSFAELSYLVHDNNEDLSLYVDSTINLNFKATINNKQVQTHDFGQAEIVQLPKLKKGDKLKMRFEFKENKGLARIVFAKINKEVREWLDANLKLGFNWQTVTSRHLKGSIGELASDIKNSYLYTTIPYDLGWRLFIDGHEMKRISWLDINEQKQGEAGAFLAFTLPKQLNPDSKIDLIFLPAKYLPGLAISLFAAIISIAYIYLLYRRRQSV